MRWEQLDSTTGKSFLEVELGRPEDSWLQLQLAEGW
jgi:hypothetical protein